MPELAFPSGILSSMAGSRRDTVREDSSDEFLAERVRVTGDVAAFSVLVTRYRVRVIALARRMLASSGPEEAEDVAQEAFVAAYDKRATFRRGDPFRPWLYRIAVNRCLDRLRAQSRRPLPIEIGSVPEPSLPGADPLDALLAEEGEERLAAAVAALPPKLRAVFLLRHLDDLSYEEIATAAGVPLGTVKTHLFRARAQLRAALAGYLEP
jgi:RNA polymerase sigma-70 factor (ECF subfamily)